MSESAMHAPCGGKERQRERESSGLILMINDNADSLGRICNAHAGSEPVEERMERVINELGE